MQEVQCTVEIIQRIYEITKRQTGNIEKRREARGEER